MSAGDLSGEWRGIFNYPHGNPPTEFTATLQDASGLLSGETVEPSLYGGTSTARIDGRRVGETVTFIKLYEESRDGEYDTVAYEGEVDTEGLEITGRWTIPGVWSGTFIMVRKQGAKVAAEAEATETVE